MADEELAALERQLTQCEAELKLLLLPLQPRKT